MALGTDPDGKPFDEEQFNCASIVGGCCSVCLMTPILTLPCSVAHCHVLTTRSLLSVSTMFGDLLCDDFWVWSRGNSQAAFHCCHVSQNFMTDTHMTKTGTKFLFGTNLRIEESVQNLCQISLNPDAFSFEKRPFV